MWSRATSALISATGWDHEDRFQGVAADPEGGEADVGPGVVGAGCGEVPSEGPAEGLARLCAARIFRSSRLPPPFGSQRRADGPVDRGVDGDGPLPRPTASSRTWTGCNDRSARAWTLARGPSRNGSAGRWLQPPGVRTACRSGSSACRPLLPEDDATSYASPPGPESQRPLPTVPGPARCEQRTAAARPPAAAFFSPVLAPAQNHWLTSGRQGN